MNEDFAPVAPILGVAHASPDFAVPPGSCDCHTHVFGPAVQFPYDEARHYTPGEASVQELLALQAGLGLSRVVIVQPSPYGIDNSCTLDALRQLGERGRGVAVIGPEADMATLEAMHAGGIRGVRVNLETQGIRDVEAARQMLAAAATQVALLGWHLQIFTGPDVILALREVLSSLPVPVVLDHFGLARDAEHPGFRAMLELVERGHAYVKLSAPQRISSGPERKEAATATKALILANPERLVWGSDWPHPGAWPDTLRRKDTIEPFHSIDDGSALNRLAAWLENDGLLRQILTDNPARLYDFPTSDRPPD